MRILEPRKSLCLLSIFMIRYFLRAVYNSAIKTLFFWWGTVLAIPYAAKVDFSFLTPNSINMQDWPSLAIFYTILSVWTRTASVCLLERLTDIIRILGEHLKSNGTSFQGTVWTKWVSKCKGTRSAQNILFLWFLVLGVALYDETKMMLYRWKSHVTGHTNHSHPASLKCLA